MDILKFTLKGKTAFFKKPEANSYFYFTYGQIHKVALLGMFGAILGYKGYSGRCDFQKTKQDLSPGYPEFYEKLKSIKISIVPHAKNGMFAKKIQSFNNSVGYASKEQGGNLIVKEQWLENPAWDIYIMLDCDESKKIASALMQSTCVYTPYLGKNDHFADIVDVKQEKAVLKDICEEQIHSLVPKDKVEFDDEGMSFRYEEVLPTGLNENTNLYEYTAFIITDMVVEETETDVYAVQDRNLVFY